jgi:hypothetical protein
VSEVPTWVRTLDVLRGDSGRRNSRCWVLRTHVSEVLTNVGSPNAKPLTCFALTFALVVPARVSDADALEVLTYLRSSDVSVSRRLQLFTWTVFLVNVRSPEICVGTSDIDLSSQVSLSINSSLPISNCYPLIHCNQPLAKTTHKHSRLPSPLPFAPNFDSIKD